MKYTLRFESCYRNPDKKEHELLNAEKTVTVDSIESAGALLEALHEIKKDPILFIDEADALDEIIPKLYRLHTKQGIYECIWGMEGSLLDDAPNKGTYFKVYATYAEPTGSDEIAILSDHGEFFGVYPKNIGETVVIHDDDMMGWTCQIPKRGNAPFGGMSCGMGSFNDSTKAEGFGDVIKQAINRYKLMTPLAKVKFQRNVAILIAIWFFLALNL